MQLMQVTSQQHVPAVQQTNSVRGRMFPLLGTAETTWICRKPFRVQLSAPRDKTDTNTAE